jgi:hypothetical protein
MSSEDRDVGNERQHLGGYDGEQIHLVKGQITKRRRMPFIGAVAYSNFSPPFRRRPVATPLSPSHPTINVTPTCDTDGRGGGGGEDDDLKGGGKNVKGGGGDGNRDHDDEDGPGDSQEDQHQTHKKSRRQLEIEDERSGYIDTE